MNNSCQKNLEIGSRLLMRLYKAVDASADAVWVRIHTHGFHTSESLILSLSSIHGFMIYRYLLAFQILFRLRQIYDDGLACNVVSQILGMVISKIACA